MIRWREWRWRWKRRRAQSRVASPPRRGGTQTSFGDDYVFQIASCQEISTLAVSLSTNALKFYSPATGQYLGECTGHTGTIHEIAFSAPASPQVICSCSGIVLISLLNGGTSHEMFSFSFGGTSGNLLAAGSNFKVMNARLLFLSWTTSSTATTLCDDRLWVIGGTSEGTLGYFPVRNDPVGAIGSAEAVLEGGHTGVIRTICPAGSSLQSLGQNKGIFGWTGGEDGRLCCWRSDDVAATKKSWIFGTLVSRVEKRTRSRHQPY